MLKKKRGYFVQNSLLLVPKYFRRQKNTILSSKIFPTKNVAKKEGGIRTEFTIPNSEIFPEIEKYNSQFYFLQNMLRKKEGGFHTEFTIPTQENTISRTKTFPTKNDGKGGGVDMSYRIHSYVTKIPHVGIEKFNQNNRILRYKIFPNPTKNVGKKRGYVVQNSLLSYKISACGDREIQHKQQNSAIKIFPTKNVANGGTLKYFLQKMLQKYRRPNQQKFGKSNRQKWGQTKYFL